MARTAVIALAAALVAGPVAAEVKSSAADSFTLEFEAEVTATPAAAYAGIGAVDRWWEAGHTYSGDSANLDLDLEAGGCFCEYFPDGGEVEHGRVLIAWPERMVRLEAALGPLQEMAVNGVLTFAWEPADDGGEGLRLIATYVVNGPGVGALATAVDQVIGAQFSNWARFVETGAWTAGGLR